MEKAKNKIRKKTRSLLILQTGGCSYQQIFLMCVDMSHIVVNYSHEMNRGCEKSYIVHRIN